MATKKPKATTLPINPPSRVIIGAAPWLAIAAKVETAILQRCGDHRSRVTSLLNLYDVAAAALGYGTYNWVDSDTIASAIRKHVRDLISAGKITKVGGRYLVPDIGAEVPGDEVPESPVATGRVRR